MKLVLKNSNLVFAKSLSQVSYTYTESKYLKTDGTLADTQYPSNYVTNELEADNYIISGCFAHETDRINVAWYDSNHNFISGENLTNGTAADAKHLNVLLQKPLNAAYVRFAAIYTITYEDYNVKLQIYTI